MNVSRVYRLLKLITLLRSGRQLDADTLAAELKVSRRTFFRDLKLLERAGIPYHFDHGRNTYALADTFFLPPLHLSFEESLAILLVSRKFLSRQVHPMYQQAVDAALKIESTLPAPVLEHCGSWLSNLSLHWPATSSVDAVSNLFNTVQRALADCHSIRVRYDSVYDGKEIDVLLDPLRLIFMARGWYLLAKSHQHGEVRTFKMDRVISMTATDKVFEPDETFSERRYFGKAWQMIPEGRLYDVKLRFIPEVAASVEEVHWHETQNTQRLEDDSLLFEAQVDGLKEITPWIMGYGDQVEVLSPRELRDRIRHKAERMAQRAQALDSEETA